MVDSPESIMLSANEARWASFIAENAQLTEEVARLRRRQGAEDCKACGYPMDNEDPDQGDDQWFCPRCQLTADLGQAEQEITAGWKMLGIFRPGSAPISNGIAAWMSDTLSSYTQHAVEQMHADLKALRAQLAQLLTMKDPK